jgi:hypothetical protein
MTRPLLPSALWAAVLLLGCALCVWVAWPVGVASWRAMPAMADIRAWQQPRAKTPTLERMEPVRTALYQALAVQPRSAELLEAMGYWYWRAAQHPDQFVRVRPVYVGQALAYWQQSLQARPMAATTWGNTLLALHALHLQAPAPPALWEAFDKAWAYGQRDPQVRNALTQTALARWDELGPERQQHMRRLQASGWPP